LTVHVIDGHSSEDKACGFELYNTHGVPQPKTVNVTLLRRFDTEGNTLSVEYATLTPQNRPILQTTIDDRAIDPRHPLTHASMAPFLYSDGRHAFYVSSEQRVVPVHEWNGFELGLAEASQ